MSCKHEKTTGYMWREYRIAPGMSGYLWFHAFVQPGDPSHHHRVTCDDCGAWLSLGPSNDDDPRVAVEVRAAEIAADEDELMGVCESFGWESLLAPKFSTDPADAGYADKWHAGYLAHQIVAHDATHSEDA